jgi:lipid A 3-O-deacylase
MPLIKKLFYPTFLMVLLVSPYSQADTSNDSLMNLTIMGAIASLGFACYQGQDPCVLKPNLDTERKTLSIDQGSDETIHQVRLAFGANWQNDLYNSEQFRISGRWEVNLNYWYSSQIKLVNKDGYILGLTPVFNYDWKLSHITPYVELGGGPQLLSDVTIENEFKSTQFQFGSIFGLGIKSKGYEVGYRYLHISNANIELPNPGTDIHGLHIAYKF